ALCGHYRDPPHPRIQSRRDEEPARRTPEVPTDHPQSGPASLEPSASKLVVRRLLSGRPSFFRIREGQPLTSKVLSFYRSTFALNSLHHLGPVVAQKHDLFAVLRGKECFGVQTFGGTLNELHLSTRDRKSVV